MALYRVFYNVTKRLKQQKTNINIISSYLSSGVTETEQQNMFTVLAAILHIGNIDITSQDPDGESDEQEDGAYISVSI